MSKQSPKLESSQGLGESIDDSAIAEATAAKNWERVIELHLERAQRSRDPRVICKAYKSVGEIALLQMNNPELARSYYELAREQQRGDAEVLEALAALYLEADRLEDARLALERLVLGRDRQKLEDMSLLAEDLRLLGSIALRSNSYERAFGHYKESFEIDQTNRETLERLADLCHYFKDHTLADTVDRNLFFHYSKQLSAERSATLLTRKAQRLLATGQRSLALNKLLDALDAAPKLREPREQVIAFYTADKNWPEVISHRRVLAGLLETPEEKANNLKELGVMYLEQVLDEERAVRCFEEAQQLVPSNTEIWGLLKKYYSERGEWKKLVEFLSQLFQKSTDDKVRLALLEETAILQIQKLNNLPACVEALHRALDIHPQETKYFNKINQLLADRRDLVGLEDSFRRMLRRVEQSSNDELKTLLWLGLSNVCREARKPSDAIAAYEQIVALNPKNTKYREQLAALYQEVPSMHGKAIEQHLYLLRAEPLRLASLHALFDLYLGRDKDRALLVANTVAVLDVPKDAERSLLRESRQGFRRARGHISESLWQHRIAHVDEDRFLTSLFAIVSPTLAKSYAKPQRELTQLRRGDRVDLLKNDDLAISGTLKYLCDCIEVEYPELYLPMTEEELVCYPTMPATMLAGQELLSRFSAAELAFRFAQQLVYLRAPYQLLYVLQNNLQELPKLLPNLRGMYVSLLRLADSEFRLSAMDEALVPPFLLRVKRDLSAEQVREIRSLVAANRTVAEKADLATWLAHVELGSLRLAFALSGDLPTAIRVIEADTRVGRLTTREKLQDLLQYSYSEAYAGFREELGLRVGGASL